MGAPGFASMNWPIISLVFSAVLSTHGIGAENVAGLTLHDVVEAGAHDDVHHVDDHARLSTAISTRDAPEDVEAQGGPTDVVDSEEYPAPTEEERKTLRKVHGTIPWTAWGICFVELAERASYYGASTVFNNYIEFPLPPDGPGTGAINGNNPNDTAGALGLGVQTSSALVLLFMFLAYVVPIFGAWWADTRIGKWHAIWVGVLICGVAHVILSAFLGGAAPAVLKAGKGFPPFIISLILLAIGAGIFKPNVSPMLIDQYKHQKEYTKVLKSGEKVLVDPESTINRICLIFYAFVNIGAFFEIAAVYIEKYKGYWQAYLAPGAIYFALPVLLLLISKRMVKLRPQGSDLTRFVKMTIKAIKVNKGNFFAKNFWKKIEPATLEAQGTSVSYGIKDVYDCKRTWEAVSVFLYVPIWSINDGGVGSILSNQAASMTSNGAPNDLLNNFNPIVIIIASPLLAQFIYPYLRGRGWKLGPISRMTFGFVLATLSGIAGAIVQYYVYKTSPCGYYASTCGQVSPIPIWWQLPNVGLGALSECFVFVTGYEIAYARAPPHMRATVTSLFLFMTALAAALGEILVPAIVDPTLIWGWAAPAIALAVQTIVFVYRHRGMNDDAFMIREEDFEPQAEQKLVEQADTASTEKQHEVS
ncbi:POT family protein [Xylariaceae sp. FL0255]|nr:POT family protein [Xylariaceae sp. FL0255]